MHYNFVIYLFVTIIKVIIFLYCIIDKMKKAWESKNEELTHQG